MSRTSTQYIQEYSYFSVIFPCLFKPASNSAYSKASNKLNKNIETSDVVVYGKMGCGYCKRAIEGIEGTRGGEEFKVRREGGRGGGGEWTAGGKGTAGGKERETSRWGDRTNG